MLAHLSYFTRRRETPLARFLYRFARGVMRLNVPSVRFIHRSMYATFFGLIVGLRWIKQKFFFEPMFRSMCASCGRGLAIDIGLPQVGSHLELHIGDGVWIGGGADFYGAASKVRPVVRIGDNTRIGFGSTIAAANSVTIGRDCLIATRVWISDSNGHPMDPARRHDRVLDSEVAPIVIGDNVWIGMGAFIGPGVTIGEGSIVAANSVVSSAVPANVVVIGAPARVVRMLKTEQLRANVRN